MGDLMRTAKEHGEDRKTPTEEKSDEQGHAPYQTHGKPTQIAQMTENYYGIRIFVKME
jgi:hypothetical protein